MVATENVHRVRATTPLLLPRACPARAEAVPTATVPVVPVLQQVPVAPVPVVRVRQPVRAVPVPVVRVLRPVRAALAVRVPRGLVETVLPRA